MTGAAPPPRGSRSRVEQRESHDQGANQKGLSEAVRRVLERCLAERPEIRFQSFVELLTQLENPRKTIFLPAAPPKPPGYHVLSFLGAGGMGMVYKAQAVQSNRRVALKFIRPQGADRLDLLARFRVEAEAIACLRHPHIVRVLEIGAYGGFPYLALEYVEGGSVQDHLDEFVSEPALSAHVIAAAARGLYHAHRLGILHRDLKPQNILLTSDRIPKIADFGLAKFTVSGQSRERL